MSCARMRDGSVGFCKFCGLDFGMVLGQEDIHLWRIHYYTISKDYSTNAFGLSHTSLYLGLV